MAPGRCRPYLEVSKTRRKAANYDQRLGEYSSLAQRLFRSDLLARDVAEDDALKDVAAYDHDVTLTNHINGFVGLRNCSDYVRHSASFKYLIGHRRDAMDAVAFGSGQPSLVRASI